MWYCINQKKQWGLKSKIIVLECFVIKIEFYEPKN